MAKSNQFRAYDLHRKKEHTIPSPPVKISTSRLARGKWTLKAAKNPTISKTRTGRTRKAKAKAAKKSLRPKRATDLLCLDTENDVCMHCCQMCDEPECGTQCYDQFCKENYVPELFDIRGPGPSGYGAYTKPGVTIKKGQYLDEYVGDLVPIDHDNASLYRFEVANDGHSYVVDAEKAGNWTRFINSSCRPNVQPVAGTIGGRRVIVFQATKDIGQEEEVVFNYGKGYFEKAGFMCKCKAHDKPHVPGTAPKGKKR